MGSKIIRIALLCLLPFIGFGQVGFRKADTALVVTDAGQIRIFKNQDYYENALRIKSDTLTSTSVAYVETTGSDVTGKIGRPDRPFATILAAMNALPSTGGDIRIGKGDFVSPGEIKKSNLRLLGSGKPVPDWTMTLDSPQVSGTPNIHYTSPTKLIGGTVIKGAIGDSTSNGWVMKDLGVDMGPAYIAGGGIQNSYGSIWTVAPRVKLGQKYWPQRTGVMFINVAAMNSSATVASHAIVLENLYAPRLENISTYFGTHGLVFKSTNGSIVGLDGHGHNTSCLAIVANYYAYCEGVTATNIFATSIAPFDTGIGVYISGDSPHGTWVNNVKVSNFAFQDIRGGIQINQAKGVEISNGSIVRNTSSGSGYAIFADSTNTDVKLNNIRVDYTRGVRVDLGSSNSGAVVSNLSVTNTYSPSTGLMFNNYSAAGQIITSNIFGKGNTSKDYSVSGSVWGVNNQFISGTSNTGTFKSYIDDSSNQNVSGLKTFVNGVAFGGSTGIRSSVTGTPVVFRNNAGTTTNSTIISASGTGTTNNQVFIRPNGDMSVTGQTIFNPDGSVVFSGIATAPTAIPGTNTTGLATTAFVQNALQGVAKLDTGGKVLSSQLPVKTKFTVVPNVDIDGDTIGVSGLSYNTQTDEYIMGYFSYGKEAKIWFYHRSSPNLLTYNPYGTLNPIPDRSIDVTAYINNIQGVAYDDSNNTYWALGSLNDVSSDTERVLINVDDAGTLLSTTTLSTMSFQAGMLILNNTLNEFIIKPNDKAELYFLDKTTKLVTRTELNVPLFEGLAFDPIMNTIWIGSDEGYVNVYDYTTFELVGSSYFGSLHSENVLKQNVEGMLIDPIDGKLLIAFDGWLHGGNNNGNCLWKYNIGNNLYSQPGGGFHGTLADANKGVLDGNYFVTSITTNIPVAGNGYITVIGGQFGTTNSFPIKTQRIYYFTGNREFQRNYTNNVWSAWVETPKLTNATVFTNTLTATQFKVSALNTAPASATATGTPGEIRITATYIYVCTATNTWVRSALTTW